MADTPIQQRGSLIRSRALARRGQATPRKRVTNTNPDRILAREKQRRALELRKSGATYDAIARAAGYYDASAARKAVVSAMAEIVQEPAQELKTLQVERLNHMLLVTWSQVQAGDTRAIDSALRIMDKLDRLMGTEAAQKVDIQHDHSGAVLVIEGSRDEYLAAMKKMAGVVDTKASPMTQAPQLGIGDQGTGSLASGSLPQELNPVPAQSGEGAFPVLVDKNGDGDEIITVPGMYNTKKFDFSVEPGEEDK